MIHGYTAVGNHQVEKLVVPDSRDVAQFIFFEVAAQFEDFAKTMFQMEVRSKLRVTAKRSCFVMGDLDGGLNNKLGWGSPKLLRERGSNLFGPDSFFGDLMHEVGEPTYKALMSAHTVRNRIAHSGGTAQERFVKLLESDGIASAERQGLSVGRYLREYPTGSTVNDRHFNRFLTAYETFAARAEAALP
ncbi:hypothetical protein ACLBKS_03040 [Hylemonella sp. W303a]|uniref:hypothetical protein n=1 Tax=Hylemonella sp. W303a TaxID=3389873 RepID=UPI00396AFC27